MLDPHRIAVTLYLLAAGAGIAGLASCMREVPPVSVVSQCPPLQQYTPAQQTAALAELQANEGKIPQTKQLLNDYNTLRNACRAGAIPTKKTKGS